MTVSPAEHAALPEVLQGQHDDLAEWLGRLPELQGAARCDVFLQGRRRLAVHQAFEELLVVPRLGLPSGGPDAPDAAAPEVEVAEQLPIDSAEFDAAVARLVAAHQRHARQQETTVLPRLREPLTPVEAAAVATATELWWGDGEAYLGNTYREMVPAAREQIAHAGDVPPPVES